MFMRQAGAGSLRYPWQYEPIPGRLGDVFFCDHAGARRGVVGGGAGHEPVFLAGTEHLPRPHPLFQWVAKLNNLRRLYPALSLGTQVSRYSNSAGPGLYVYSRLLGAQELLVVLNTAETAQLLPALELTYPSGTKLANLLDPAEVITITTGSRTPPVTIPPTTAKIFVSLKEMRPLDPVVVATQPSHSADRVSGHSPIVLRFSLPMDTNRVQTAFSLSQPVPGQFVWSAAGDQLTFTPDQPGFVAGTKVMVRLDDSATDAAAGNRVHGGFELRFSTANAPGTPAEP